MSSIEDGKGSVIEFVQNTMNLAVCGVSLSPLENHVCLLDCIALDLQEMDIFAAEHLPRQPLDSGGKPLEYSDLVFPSYCVRRTGNNLLKDCCRLELKVERNLDK